MSFEIADIFLDVLPDFVQLRAFIIAKQIVDHFKGGEEGGKQSEAKVVNQSRSSSLMDEMTVKLG